MFHRRRAKLENKTNRYVDESCVKKILTKDKDLKIAFWDNCLCERGTTVSLYDYAYYNEKILNNKSIIFYDTTNRNNNNSVIKKFQAKFQVYGVDNFDKVDNVLEKENIDIIYVIKSGEIDGKVSNICNTVVHCVFNAKFKHGNIYSTIHPDVFGNDGKYPVVPHMINLPSHNENLRNILNIPKDSKVFGGYGGKDSFNILLVHKAIYTVAKQNPNIYFLFANFNPFCPKLKNIIFLSTIYDLREKVKFINTCDAMIWGRDIGETFGISIGEFSTLNKPVIATKNVRDKGHVELLGDKALWYNNGKDLTDILLNFDPKKESQKDWNAYNDYTPEKVMKKFKNIYINPFVKKYTISLAVLTYNRPKILERTLNSYKTSGLLNFVDEAIILLQENNIKERKIAEKYNLTIYHTNKNIGIGPGNNFLLNKINSEYFIICQNDFMLISDDFYNQITKPIKLIEKNELNCYNLRSLTNPGEPMHSANRLVFPEGNLEETHFSGYLYNNFFPQPEKKHPEIFNYDSKNNIYILSSEHGNFTENPVLYNKKWYKDNIYELNKADGYLAENNVQKFWEKQNFKVGYGSGLFTHNDK